jgi:DNA-binding MarR family transcriptional regulator
LSGGWNGSRASPRNELAAIAGVAPITVARLIDRIEALGLVERHVDPTDRRIWRLRLTPAAASALRDSKCHQAELDELLVKGVDNAVVDAMTVGLRKMKENLSSGRRLPKLRWPRQRCLEGDGESEW